MSKKNMQICPRCKKGYLSKRAKRSLLIKVLLFWLPIKRYKCSYCAEKVYVFGADRTGKSALEIV